MKKILLAVALLNLTILKAGFSADCVFNSGTEITYTNKNDNCWIIVRDGTSSPTIFNVTSAAVVNGRLRAFDNSRVNFYSGLVRDDLDAHHNSEVYTFGGDFNNINTYSDSYMERTGGTDWGMTKSTGNSELSMSGSAASWFLRSEDSSLINMTNGRIYSYVAALHSSRINLSGGAFGYNPTGGPQITSYSDSVITISGGNFTLWPYGSAERVYFRVYNDGLIRFIGSDFTINGQPVVGVLDLELLAAGGHIIKSTTGTHDIYQGIISGTLRNGQSLYNDFRVYRALGTGETANLYLLPSNCIENEELQALLDAALDLLDEKDAQIASLETQVINLEDQLHLCQHGGIPGEPSGSIILGHSNNKFKSTWQDLEVGSGSETINIGSAGSSFIEGSTLNISSGPRNIVIGGGEGYGVKNGANTKKIDGDEFIQVALDPSVTEDILFADISFNIGTGQFVHVKSTIFKDGVELFSNTREIGPGKVTEQFDFGQTFDTIKFEASNLTAYGIRTSTFYLGSED